MLTPSAKAEDGGDPDGHRLNPRAVPKQRPNPGSGASRFSHAGGTELSKALHYFHGYHILVDTKRNDMEPSETRNLARDVPVEPR